MEANSACGDVSSQQYRPKGFEFINLASSRSCTRFYWPRRLLFHPWRYAWLHRKATTTAPITSIVTRRTSPRLRPKAKASNTQITVVTKAHTTAITDANKKVTLAGGGSIAVSGWCCTVAPFEIATIVSQVHAKWAEIGQVRERIVEASRFCCHRSIRRARLLTGWR
jgi:hypothetical protein